MSIDASTIIWLLMLLPSITLHEFMHGYAAYRLGDPTAKDAGRLTLNPLAHIDPFGTVLLPLVLAFTSAPVFGYAKPVPYDPRHFKNLRRGDLIVALAGPAANLSLALVGAALSWIVLLVGFLMPEALVRGLLTATVALVQTNLTLMFFNLIPIPPLDGSSIIMAFLPDRAIPVWYSIQRYSFIALFAIFFIIPSVLHVDPIGAYFQWTVYPALHLLLPL